MKYFIIAGEQSGDLHGSNLIKELIQADSGAEISCWGGDLMKAAGATLLKHYHETAFMGFLIILTKLRTIAGNLALCKKQILEFNPHVLILIDYPGFNLRIAEFGKNNGYKVYYFISPKLWAWNEGRIEKIKKYVDKMYIIFPFEVEFYKKHDIPVEYYGNPLVDEISEKMSLLHERSEIAGSLGIEEKPVIALLPGSRRHEVKQILPGMLAVVNHFPEYQFVLAGVYNLSDELYLRIIGSKNIKIIKGKTYEILSLSAAAIVASGTATLEAALFNVPQVVCFKGDFFSMLIAWIVIKVKYISLVNLILNREAVRELVQYSFTEKNLRSELEAILPGGLKRSNILSDYKKIKEKLGPAGASERIARDMVGILGKRTEMNEE